MVSMPALLAAVFLAAVADWLAVLRSRRLIEYVAKPAVMILLLAWLWLFTSLRYPASWFGLGLVCSLAGDVFLMLPERTKWFTPGLAAFLFAHLMYIAGFEPRLGDFGAIFLLMALAVIAGIAWLYRRITAGLMRTNQQKLSVPVLIYAIVIAVMFLSALTTLFRPEWITLPAVLVSLGAGLFLISDIILAWDRFVAPLAHGRLLNLTAYHIGQIAIIVGAAVQLAAQHPPAG